MSIEAMKMALALNAWTHFGECRATDGPIPTPAEVDAALRQAIEQAQKQEPVAWVYEFYADMGHKGLAFEQQPSAHNTPLYTSPPPRQPLTQKERTLLAVEKLSPLIRAGAVSPIDAFNIAITATEAAHGIKENK